MADTPDIKARFENLLNKSISDEQFEKIMAKLIDTCLVGKNSTAAIKILLDTIAKPAQIDVNVNLDAANQLAQIQKTIMIMLEKND